MSASHVLNPPTYEIALAPNDALQVPTFCNQCKPCKLIALNVLLKTVTQLMNARKSRFAPNTSDPKVQDTWFVLPEVAAFKDPLTLDMGYLSRLGSSFVIEIQARSRRTGLERIC